MWYIHNIKSRRLCDVRSSRHFKEMIQLYLIKIQKSCGEIVRGKSPKYLVHKDSTTESFWKQLDGTFCYSSVGYFSVVRCRVLTFSLKQFCISFPQKMEPGCPDGSWQRRKMLWFEFRIRVASYVLLHS